MKELFDSIAPVSYTHLVIDTLGKIAIYPNLDYILPLESFKIWGNNNACLLYTSAVQAQGRPILHYY